MSDQTRKPSPQPGAPSAVLDRPQPSAAVEPSAAGAASVGLGRLEMPVEVRFGALEWSLDRVLELRAGDAVPVGRDGDDSVTLFVQGRPFAVGDLVVVDGKFGFLVRSLLTEGVPR